MDTGPTLLTDPRPSARVDNTRDRAWDATTFARFLTHVRGDRLHAAWRLAGTTGARRGEILGLRWSDIDLDAGTVTFGRQTATVVTGQLIWQQDGKTDAAVIATQALNNPTQWRTAPTPPRPPPRTPLHRSLPGCALASHPRCLPNGSAIPTSASPSATCEATRRSSTVVTPGARTA